MLWVISRMGPCFSMTGGLLEMASLLNSRVGFDPSRLAIKLLEVLGWSVPDYFRTPLAINEMESGVVAIDKSRHFLGLLAVCQLNGEMERRTTYELFYGDKETFWLEFEMIGDHAYSFSPYLPGALGPEGVVRNPFPDQANQKLESFSIVCSSKILHLDYFARPFWFNGGLLHSKFVEDDKKEFEVLTHWNAEPGYWELKEDNIGCLKSDINAKRVDTREALWVKRHQEIFLQLSESTMPRLMDRYDQIILAGSENK